MTRSFTKLLQLLCCCQMEVWNETIKLFSTLRSGRSERSVSSFTGIWAGWSGRALKKEGQYTIKSAFPLSETVAD